MDKNNINLQLFADGGAAGGDGGAAAAAAGDSTGVNVPDAGVRKSRKRENPLANVQYGVQQQSAEQVAPVDGAAEQGTETEETFESLIKGKYKPEADAWAQNLVQNRFKKNAEIEATLESHKALHELLGKKFNLDPTDINGIMRALSRDPEKVELMAMERGVTVDTMNKILDLEDKAKLYDEAEEQRKRQTAFQRARQAHLESLAIQSKEALAAYPEFDLEQEMTNPQFMRMTGPGGGFTAKQAYEAIHHQEIVNAVMQQQAQAFTKSVKANGARPAENGLKAEQGASTVKTDPRSLTPADRAEIRRRVARGERIIF